MIILLVIGALLVAGWFLTMTFGRLLLEMRRRATEAEKVLQNR
jgi:hypothetical protein